MTAEEWLKENCHIEDWQRTTDVLNDFIHTNNVIEYLEKYKQEAEMGFAEWASCNGWSYCKPEKEWTCTFGVNFGKCKTTSELYKIWLESNKPTQN